MQFTCCGRYALPREAGQRLLWAALAIATAVLVGAMLKTVGLGAVASALLIAGAGLWGGWLLNPHARVPGLPSTMAGLMGLAVYVGALASPTAMGASGGLMFVTLLVSVVSRSRTEGFAATAIMAGAQILSSLL